MASKKELFFKKEKPTKRTNNTKVLLSIFTRRDNIDNKYNVKIQHLLNNLFESTCGFIMLLATHYVA